MATITTEIASDVFRLSTFIPELKLQFNQFLVRDEKPLLYHTGMRGLFSDVHAAVARLIDPASLRFIGFSHFEADECGSLGEWLTCAPRAAAVCSEIAKFVNVDDMIGVRPARALADEEVLVTGTHRFRFLQTPQVPHAWDAGLMFDESSGTLLCSDLFHQLDDVEPLTENDVVGRFRATLENYQQGPFADYLPFTAHTVPTLERLAALEPTTLAAMHGSAFSGDCSQAIRDLGSVMREVFEA
jgi:flavorubredoxin